ncbi:MAG: hypothetical protein PUP92_32410 [Rhizonema sp. PD38]|nr:hypothetical protein [Rhizonema sp. PD38]
MSVRRLLATIPHLLQMFLMTECVLTKAIALVHGYPWFFPRLKPELGWEIWGMVELSDECYIVRAF